MFRHTVLIMAGLLACGVQAGVYRWVDAEGNVHYGDQPPAEGAEQIRLHVQKPPATAGSGGDASVPGDAGNGSGDGIYTKLTVAQPAPDATIPSADGKVVLQLVLEPQLQADHYLEITLDGALVDGKQTTSVMVLQGVVRGRHELQVSVFDAEGQRLASSSVVHFYLRQSSPAEREGAEQDYQEWLTERQREREAAIEAERREQQQRQQREQAEQKARIEERRRSDFGGKAGQSPVFKDSYPEVPTTKAGEAEKYTKERTDLQAPDRPRSTDRHGELQTYDPAAIPKQQTGESADFDPNAAPRSEPIRPYTGQTPNPAYAPSYSPPAAPAGN
jgi:hypothetical protein